MTTAYAITQKFGHLNTSTKRELCGVFTRDFRNSLLDCKILVTVPQCLFIIAINDSYSKWFKNVKYVVFDEIHTMGGESNTDVWEQLILLIECPFIALSATLSNSTNIFEWLKSLEKHKSQFNPLNKRKIKLIEYLDRHNDLKRFIYTNSEFKSIHPVGFLNVSSVKKHQCLPNDLSLTANETVELYDCLKSVNLNDLENLDLENCNYLSTKPSQSLFITKNSVKEYEVELKRVLEFYLLNDNETQCAKKIIKALEPKFEANETYPSMSIKQSLCDVKEEHGKCFINLIEDLIGNNQLPCIIFTNNRLICETYAVKIQSYLEENNIILGENLDNKIFDSQNIHTLFGIETNQMLNAGVAFHHSGVIPQLKSLIEAYFRIGKIKIILATATLALGVKII